MYGSGQFEDRKTQKEKEHKTSTSKTSWQLEGYLEKNYYTKK